jgi:hypothetical protein
MPEPFKSKWGNPDAQRGWLQGLEELGPANVRPFVATPHTSETSVVLTNQCTPLKGFVQDWLRWKDAERAEAEEAREGRMIAAAESSASAAKWAAIAAGVAAVGTLIQAGAALLFR